MKIQPITLEGERVSLMPLERKHIAELWQTGNNYPEIWDYMFLSGESFEGMTEIVEQALLARDEGKELPFVIYDKKLGRIVGSTRFMNIAVHNRSLEIGWTWYDKEVWRTRVNTETKYLLLCHCFETLQTNRVQLKCDNRNKRSMVAIQRIGAKPEGVLRADTILRDGYVRDTAYFSIIQREWSSVKSHLEALLYETNTIS